MTKGGLLTDHGLEISRARVSARMISRPVLSNDVPPEMYIVELATAYVIFLSKVVDDYVNSHQCALQRGRKTHATAMCQLCIVFSYRSMQPPRRNGGHGECSMVSKARSVVWV